MSLKKFQQNDIIVSTMQAHPKCDFFIWNGSVYYNNVGYNSGAFTQHSKNVPTGNVNLYEYNVDRLSGSTSFSDIKYYVGATAYSAELPAGVPNTPRPIGHSSDLTSIPSTNPYMFPYITRDAHRVHFKTVLNGEKDYWSASWGDVMYGVYPQSASISREFVVNQTASTRAGWERFRENPHYRALRSKLNYLGAISEHYKVSSPDDGFHPGDPGGAPEYLWHKDHQTMAIVSIPSIFYGSKIKPGTVSLRWYVTGALCGEIRDINQNGELIQVSGGIGTPGFSAGGTSSPASKTEAFNCSIGSVAGVVLYDEGFIILTGSWPLSKESIVLTPGSTTASLPSPGPAYKYHPRWWNWGCGALDGCNSSSMDYMFGKADSGADGGDQASGILANGQFSSASYGLSFEGTTNTQVVTMFAHAKRGEVNFSNNPTYLQYGQKRLKTTSSYVYEENPQRLIKNTVSSSFADHSASFQRQVYVSKIAIYDDNKNLIGVASLANPVRKREDEDITFKLRIDI